MSTKQINLGEQFLRGLAFSLLGIVVCTSCKDENWIEESKLHCHVRECEHIVTYPILYGEKEMKNYKNEPYTTSYLTWLDSGSEVSAHKFLLFLATGSDDLIKLGHPKAGKDCDFSNYFLFGANLGEQGNYPERMFGLEKELMDDYWHKSRYTRPLLRAAGLDYLHLVNWAYRVTGVKSFRIEALESLFGQAPETSLNEYFGIYEFYPRQIISHRTKELVWGYRDKDEVKTIDEWLSLEPMAPPSVKFHLLSTPPEAPLDVHFVSILETTDGKELRDTLAVRLLP